MVEEDRCESALKGTDEKPLSLDAVQLHDSELDASLEPIISISASSTVAILTLKHTIEENDRNMIRRETIANKS